MRYRAEIDGLRALAVVPVILFHAGFETFSGGFVGVDVFFVVSGYLITTIIIEGIEREQFSIAKFYERRARRILPALFLVMLCCVPFAWMWMIPSQMKEFSQSFFAVSLFISNILFFYQSGYFDAAAEEKPLLHTWSLAVEEQYYIVFPVFLVLAWRFGKTRTFWMIVVFSIASFALSEWTWRTKATASFYLAHTRAWELLAGSIAAFLVQKRGVKASNTLSLSGLAAIVFSVLAYDESTPFPSVYALPPVLGVVLLVLYAGKDTLVVKLLGAKALVGVGLISYSAYLWHQPLFAFARIRSIGDPSVSLMISLSLTSLGLAFLSWKFVEQPCRVRGRQSTQRVFLYSAIGLTSFLAFGMFGHNNNGFDYRLTKQQREILAYEDYPRQPYYKEGICFLNLEQTFSEFAPECLHKEGSLVWGDSHAAALVSGWRLIEEKISQLTASGCPPILNTDMTYPPRPNCIAVNDYVVSVLRQNPNYAVYLHANWKLYGLDYERKLAETIEFLKKIGVTQITVVGGVPQYEPSLPKRLLSESVELTSTHSSEFSSEEVKALDVAIESVAHRSGVRFVSILDVFCESNRCITVVERDNRYVPTAWDYGHLTLEGSLFLNHRLRLNR